MATFVDKPEEIIEPPVYATSSHPPYYYYYVRIRHGGFGSYKTIVEIEGHGGMFGYTCRIRGEHDRMFWFDR